MSKYKWKLVPSREWSWSSFWLVCIVLLIAFGDGPRVVASTLLIGCAIVAELRVLRGAVEE